MSCPCSQGFLLDPRNLLLSKGLERNSASGGAPSPREPRRAGLRLASLSLGPAAALLSSALLSSSHGCLVFSLPPPPFSQCSDSDKNCHLWTAVDLGFFVVMGVIGGLLGATFNCLNKRLAKYRMRNVHPKPKLVRYLQPPPARGSLSLCGPGTCPEGDVLRDVACPHPAPHTSFGFSSKTENVNEVVNLPLARLRLGLVTSRVLTDAQPLLTHRQHAGQKSAGSMWPG